MPFIHQIDFHQIDFWFLTDGFKPVISGELASNNELTIT